MMLSFFSILLGSGGLAGVPVWAADRFACIVAGHGPYDESWKNCLKLAQEQAKTKCVLDSATRKVEYSYKDLEDPRDVSKVGTCESKYVSKKQKCSSPVCDPKE